MTQRQLFASLLHEQMTKNPAIVVITADLGFGILDKIRADFPDRFWNVGAAEQAAVGIAVGMALSGKIPVVYSITPFLLYRPFEWIRNYLDHENIPVKLVGTGRDKDYLHDGFTHWAEDDLRFMALFNNIACWWPDTIPEETFRFELENMLNDPRPYYLNLKR